MSRTPALRAWSLLAALLIVVVSFLTACDSPVNAVGVGRVDTVTVYRTLPPRVDTLITTRVDTLIRSHTDTTYVPRVDTLLRSRVDTVIRRVVDTLLVKAKPDTVFLPGAVVRDTSWVYLHTNPTNPLAGGDPSSGLLILAVTPDYYLTFWHGHFVGVLESFKDATTGAPAWAAYAAPYAPDDTPIEMHRFCTKWTLTEAAQCLVPITFVLTPSGARASLAVQERRLLAPSLFPRH